MTTSPTHDDGMALRFVPGPDGWDFKVTGHRTCQHKSVDVDAESRSLTCQKCKAILDPFDFVVSLARESNFDRERHARLREMAALEGQVRTQRQSRCRHSRAEQVHGRPGWFVCHACNAEWKAKDPEFVARSISQNKDLFG
jgi:hypothetical protein